MTALLLGTLAASKLCSCARSKECVRDLDCPAGSHCLTGFCQSDCRFDVDCPPERPICVEERGYCVGSDGGVIDASTPSDARADAASLVDAQPNPDSHVVTPDGTVVSGAYTDYCTDGSQCVSGLCLSDLRTPRKFCTGSCSSNAQCIMSHICDSLGAQKYCQPSDIGVVCSGTGQCADQCIGNAMTGVGHCTRPCATRADCPAGFACTQLGNEKYCVDLSMGCTDPMDCLTGVCLSDFGIDACSTYCVSAADCPLYYTCETDNYNYYCVPPGGGTGGLGDPCTSNCISGLCLGTYCTVDCGVTRNVGQECPPGYGCSPAGSGTDYTLVCSLAGTGGFGQSCTESNQCASAVCMQLSDQTFECSRFCNDGIPCPTGYSCVSMGMVASGVSLSVCYR